MDLVVKPRSLPSLAATPARHEQSVDLSDEEHRFIRAIVELSKRLVRRADDDQPQLGDRDASRNVERSSRTVYAFPE